MTREQRYRLEMFVRVRDFGLAHRDRFPETSTGGMLFDQVARAVAAVDEHLKQRILARAAGRGIKPLTRAAVYRAMKVIAKAARRVTRGDREANPFRMPHRRTLNVELATARVFIDEAATRKAGFLRLGLPPTFIEDLTELVNELQGAVDTRLSSKTARGHAQAGIASTMSDGLEAIRDLEVIVEIALQDAPALAAAWSAARYIEGQRSSASTRTTTPAQVVPADVTTSDATLRRAS